jgi:hypothetical protein
MLLRHTHHTLQNGFLVYKIKYDGNMISRYDVPAQDNYKNTYVPLPYEQIMNTVAARQAQLQREQDMLNKTYEDTQNLKYIPGTKDEVYVRDYLAKAGDLVNKYYGQDLSNPIVKAQLRREFSGITNRQDLQNIQTSHDAWMTNQKYKAQLKAEGLYDPAIDEDPANANFDSRQGVYQYIAPSYKNPRPSAEQYFNNIKASDLGPRGDYNYSGVTRDKINSVADQKWGDFVNTSEGNMYVKKIAKERGLDYTDPKVRQQIGTEYLKGVGEEFIFRDQGTPTLEAQVRAARGKKGENGEYRNTTQRSSYRTTPHYDPYKLGTVKFDKTGNILTSPISTGQTAGTPGLSGGNYGKGFFQKEPTVQSKSDEENAIKEKLQQIRENLPQLKGMTDAETYKAYDELRNDANAVPDLPVIDVPGIPRDKLADQLANSMLNRQIMIMDDFGSSDLRAATDTGQNSPLRDLGYTTQSLKQAIKKGIVTVGGLAQNGPMAGMIQLEAPDMSKKGGGKGQDRKLYISFNDQVKAFMSPTNDVYDNIRSFKHGITPLGVDAEGRQIGVEVIPSIQQDPNSKKWVYEYQLNQGYITPDGKLTSPDPLHPDGIPTNIDRVGQMQLNRLLNSGYINSEVNFTNDNTAPSF